MKDEANGIADIRFKSEGRLQLEVRDWDEGTVTLEAKHGRAALDPLEAARLRDWLNRWLARAQR